MERNGALKPGQEAVMQILSRYVSTWKGQPILTPPATAADIAQPAVEIRGPVALRYRSIVQPVASADVVRRIRQMAALPQFYRLNLIRQLSSTPLAVNLEGAHNRLSHCLGTLDNAACLVDAVQQQLPVKEQLTRVEIKAILVYAFVHDCFHGPMGHSLDLIRDVLWGRRAAERVDKYLLKRHVDEKSGFLWDAVLAYVADSESERNQIFLQLSTFLSIRTETRAFLVEIVDSDLDADRIDYIWRDHTHLEMTGFEKIADISKMIASAAALEKETSIPAIAGMGDVVDQDKQTERHLYYSDEHAAAIRDLLERRVDFYRRYYEHPMKVVADEMLVHAIYYTLATADMLEIEGGTVGNFADDFAYLTDDGLVGLLTQLTSGPEYAIPATLLSELRANRPFEIVYEKGLKRSNFGDLVRRDVVTTTAKDQFMEKNWEGIQRAASMNPLELAGNREYESLIKSFEAILTEPIYADKGGDVLSQAAFKKAVKDNPESAVYFRKIDYSEQNDILRLEVLYGSGFTKRVKLERLLWHKLLRENSFDKKLFTVADAIGTAAKISTTTAFEQLQKQPLIFITPSWIPAISEEALKAHNRGFRRGELRLHHGYKSTDIQLELRTDTKEFDYPLIVSAPRILTTDEVIKSLIISTFTQVLSERKWLEPDHLNQLV